MHRDGDALRVGEFGGQLGVGTALHEDVGLRRGTLQGLFDRHGLVGAVVFHRDPSGVGKARFLGEIVGVCVVLGDAAVAPGSGRGARGAPLRA